MAGIGCSTVSSPRRAAWGFGHHHLGIANSRRYQKKNLLVRAEVNFVNADEAKRLVDEEGYTILDVRDRTQYERAHIKTCYHVPLFVENKDNDLGTVIKRTVHNNFSGLFFGLSFTKPNPDFVGSVKKQFSTDSKILLVCQEGLRSAAAAKKLEAEGFENLYCITSGLQTVNPGTFDSVGSTELQNAGKAGLVTIQGKISAVLGTVLIYCNVAEPVIYQKLSASSGDVALLRAFVGDRPTWRNPAHSWRVDPRFELKGVPTLIRWEINEEVTGRLEDYEAHVEKKIDALLK